MSLKESMRWYVLHAINGRENKVKEYIESAIEEHMLGNVVSQVLVPTEKVYRVRNGKKVVVEQNLYSGYVLIEAVLTDSIYRILRNIPGVLGFLGDNGKGTPNPLSLLEVRRLLGVVDRMKDITSQDSEVEYIVGEDVKVVVGPFSGFSGVVEEVSMEKRKLRVMVKIFGRNTPLELSFAQVEKG